MITPVTIGLAKPNEDVIAQIKELLVRAEAAEIRSLIYVTEDQDGGCTTSISATLDCMKMIGQCHRLAHRLQRDMDGIAVPYAAAP